MGTATEGTDRTRCRTWRLYRSEPIAEPVHGKPEHRPIEFDVHVCVEGRHQDDLLLALTPGNEDHQDDGDGGANRAGRGSGASQCRGVLLAGKSRVLRGLSVSLLCSTSAGGSLRSSPCSAGGGWEGVDRACGKSKAAYPGPP